MGLFDTLYFDAPAPAELRCAAGHSFAGVGFQTHDLDEAMLTFRVIGDRVYTPGRSTQISRVAPDGAQLVVESCLREDNLNATLELDDECRVCAPVFVLTPGRLVENRPTAAFEVVFARGRLVRCVAVHRQTREELRQHLLSKHLRVLADDDPLVAWASAPARN